MLFLYIIPKRTPLSVAVLWRSYINCDVNTETSNMFLNKHYVVPFVKECVARFLLLYTDETVKDYIALQMKPLSFCHFHQSTAFLIFHL